jgi:1,4-alpha-glucan branching enzyme
MSIQADWEAIASGRHHDAFAVLGPHETDSGWQVATFQPYAERVRLVLPDRVIEMQKQHRAGLFTAPLLESQRSAYRLRLVYPGGVEQDIEDAYRFPPLLTDFQIHLHGEGTNHEAWRMLGAHMVQCDGVNGVRFTVWAPSAQTVSVVGDWNGWEPRIHPMRLRNGGIWEIFIPHVGRGAAYKYAVLSNDGSHRQLKTDPYSFHTEVPPKQASLVWGVPEHDWQDAAWMEARGLTDQLKRPMSIYEVHLESWLRMENGRSQTYREMVDTLIPYVKKTGFTHVELLPIAEHPFSGSWGYQVTGYFAPTSRFGTPEDFQYFVDCCHQEGIGVILDWVPAHFPRDAHGLASFDGTCTYEHADPRQGEHRGWGTLIFNYGRNEVRAFLLSNAMWWLQHFHIDGLRVDAVASMIYLDYSREPGDWIPNRHGGRENLEALDFLQRFNELAHTVPGAVTIAEESTSFPGICRPVYLGGMGFTMKWNMGWMHDMLRYFSAEPVYRKYQHNDITFSMLYAFSENFVLPISHDEVVHLKRSLISKMPGDEWRKFANVRAFLSYMWAHPGKKLLFMGQEIGQYEEWDEKATIRWELLAYDYHRQLQDTVAELNRLYKAEPAMYEVDFDHSGFEWIDIQDIDSSIISFVRYARNREDFLIFVCNFTPVVGEGYCVGAPRGGVYREVVNSDSSALGGSGVINWGPIVARKEPMHARPAHLSLRLPPLGVTVLKPSPAETSGEGLAG